MLSSHWFQNVNLHPYTEGNYRRAQVAIRPAQVIVTPDDWRTPSTVFFVISDDGTAFGDVELDVSATFTSTDTQYAALEPDPLKVGAIKDGGRCKQRPRLESTTTTTDPRFFSFKV